jgi:putative OPT family oligopeptide transporter
MDFNKPSLPEITVKAVIMGAVLSVILGAANMYFGLFAGMTISATIPAAVVSMGLLRLFKKYNILENNFIKTAASAGESLAAGVIFTIPALVIMGFWDRFYYWPITVIALFGGILGVLFTIPLRRLLIVEERLKFPEGVAAAEVLKSGYRGGSDIGYIVRSAMAGALFKLGATGLKVWAEILEGAKAVGGTVAYFGSNLSPALLSVGYIVGINIAILMFIGGALNWLVAIPICSLFTKWGVYPEGHNLAGQAMSALDWANKLWGSQTRYIGVGAMLVGGLWTIFKLRKSLLKGVMDGIRAYRKIGVAGSGGLTAERVERDIPMKWVLLGIVASIVPIFLLYEHFVDKVSVSLPMALIMVLTGFLFSAVAGYMAGLVGSSNNPVSGVTIATVLVSALILLFMLGSGAKNGPAAAIIIGGVVCCAAAIAGDVMQDLKTGHILKNTPWKLQVAEIIGTISAAFIMAPVLMLLYKAYGFKGHISGLDISGLPKKDALAAPQANLMESVAKQVFSGDVPWNFVLIGVGVAAAVIILDEYFIRRGSSFRTPVLAVAIGIYLPLELETPILAGGIISYLIQSYRRRKNTAIEFVQEGDKRGLLLASGLITGEALMGILIAVPIVILQKSEPLALMEKPIGAWPGIILLVFVAAWLYKSALGTKQQVVK